MLHGESLLLPTEAAVSHLSQVTVNSVQLKMMVQGKELPINSEFFSLSQIICIEPMDRMVLLVL